MWKPVVSIVLLIVLLVAIFELYSIYKTYSLAKLNYDSLKAKGEALRGENIKLEAEVGYLENPINLLKELRAKFDYKLPGEKSMIIIPKR